MYVILVYDMGSNRVAKMLRLCRRYLHWIQNSVFEGPLTPLQLKQLLAEAKEIMDEDYDSLIIFKSRSDRWLEKEVIGREQNDLDCFL